MATAVARPQQHQQQHGSAHGGSSHITSCAAWLAFLPEEDNQLRLFALERLNVLVNEFWAEIADKVQEIETLFEDDSFPHRKLAALLASKVHYHLEAYNESLRYALGAEDLFDVGAKDEYVETIIAKAIDEYVAVRVAAAEGGSGAAMDPRLEGIVERMFERCFLDEQWTQAIGVALEGRRLDKIEQAIGKCRDAHAMLGYTFDTCRNHVHTRSFRDSVLRLLVDLYKGLPNPDYLQICTCLLLLNDPQSVAVILEKLCHSPSEADELVALQIAFDLRSSEIQHFLLSVRNALPPPVSVPAPAPAPAGDATAATTTAAATTATTAATTTTDAMSDETPTAAAAAAAAPVHTPTPEEERYGERYQKVKSILMGELYVALQLDFLCRNVHSDMLILKNIKSTLEVRNSVTHEATVFANALMHCGTTVDSFISENLDWLKRATNWAKFSATAGFGMIYKGCVSKSLNVMRQYLPQGPGQSVSQYSDGGAYFALGIIHANHGEGILPYLTKALSGASNDVVQHGACLGLGLAGMATENEQIYDMLKDILYQDSAVAGEAAGIAMGLVMLGTHSETAVEAMLAYAHETQHEKIIRGLAMGIALLVYQKEDGADVLIEQLTRDKDPILRYGGMYAIAMAYSATSNNSAIRRLLHVAVSDVSDDVRRAAVMALGFVMSNMPSQCPRVVSLLSESYNPHVRYGATMAVGISCASTGSKEAIDLLEPMASDRVDFVRQGALIALAMVLCQQTEAREPRVATIRKMFEKVIADKHEDVMARFGAIIATGILDAGGRNVSIAMCTSNGQPRMCGVVGMALFTQSWYWFPLMHFISLTFQPTCMIALTKDLKMPEFTFTSNTKPSQFAYPPPMKVETAAAPKLVPTVQLSVTAKNKAREKKKTDAMEIDEGVKEKDTTEEDGSKATGAEEKKEETPKKEEEPSVTVLRNPGRVLLQQQRFISFEGARYEPVKKPVCGVLIVKDLRPAEESTNISLTTQHVPAADTADEPAPPEPFDYVEE